MTLMRSPGSAELLSEFMCSTGIVLLLASLPAPLYFSSFSRFIVLTIANQRPLSLCLNTALSVLGWKDRAAEPLSWKGYLQTLLVLAFCSFAIGLYWRYKFRSRYLAAELEETKNLNEQLLKSQTLEDVVQPSSVITLTGTTNESVTLQIDQLMYIEAVGNYVKVYQFRNGEVHADMLRATSKQMENDLRSYPMIVRCHRAFLVNLGQVDHLVSHSGSMQLFMKHSNETLPVSRSNMAGVKEAINGMTSI